MKYKFLASPMLFFGIMIILAVLSPLAVIWSMNTLFALDIPYTFWTWLATLILNAALMSGRYNGK